MLGYFPAEATGKDITLVKTGIRFMAHTRRTFLQRAGQAAAAGLAGVTFPAPLLWKRKPVAPSDTVVIGGIGVNGMGFGDLLNTLQLPDVVCGGLCDVDHNVLEKRAAEVGNKTGTRPPLYRDYRQLLDDQAIDAVIVGTPDHWHCLPMVHACEAGKDVYVEKPIANSIAECDIMVRAARHYERVVQVGQQQRSGKHWQDVVALVQSGKMGKIRHAKAWANFDYAAGLPRVPNTPAPPGVDFDFWLGPAPERPFNIGWFHGDWRFQWDFGGGLMTDWGAHLLDIILWAMQVEGPPKSISAAGGIFVYPDHQIETPDTLSVQYAFDDFVMTWEQNAGIQAGPYGRNYGIAFIGSNGTLVVDREGWQFDPEVKEGRALAEAVPWQRGRGSNHDLHAANFISCVKSRNDPACTVEIGRLIAFYAHAGNIAHRTDSKLVWDETKQQFRDNDAANRLITPVYRDPWKLPAI